MLSFIKSSPVSSRKLGTNNNIKERKIVINHSNHRARNLNSLVIKSTCFLFACLLGFYLVSARNQSLPSASSSSSQELIKLKQETLVKLDNYLGDLKLKYQNQSSNFWANIKSSFEHSIVRSKDPSIVLIVHDESKIDLASELTNDLLVGLNDLDKIGYASVRQLLDGRKITVKSKKLSLNDLTVNPLSDRDLVEYITRNENDKTKLAIDLKLSTIFQSGKRVALVKNIERIPAHSMIIFYTYGDDFENAKYPAIMILMTLKMPVDAQQTNESSRLTLSTDSAKLSEYVESHLSNLWSRFLGDDQLKPLFTRIANNVVYLN